jgi:exopolysaccharide biosynthesis polyprenyl glycosylphosphotransferase
MHYAIHVSLLLVTFKAAFMMRFYMEPLISIVPPIKGIPSWDLYKQALPAIAASWTIVTVVTRYYKQRNITAYDDFVHALNVVSITFLILMAIPFVYRVAEYSRLVLVLSWGLSIIVIFVSGIFIRLIESWVLLKIFGAHRILIVGKGKSTALLRDILQTRRGFKVYYYEHDLHEKFLRRFIMRRKIDEVVVIRNNSMDHAALLKIASVCEEYAVDFKFIPDILELRMGELVIDQSFGIPMLQLKPLSLHSFNYYFKRCIDIVLSIAMLAIGFIPLVMIGILIKLESRGPFFYRQERVGYKSKIIMVYKFRTMVQNADMMIDSMKHLSERGGPVFKMKNDPRVTKVGNILRVFSLDELPQIINVLKGEMSLIGPRPQVIWEANAYDENDRKRLNILPGITGLWQVSGRASLSYMEMIQLDLFYLENWTPGLDIKILLKTIPTILSRSGAY